jgi:predicted DNA binding protein
LKEAVLALEPQDNWASYIRGKYQVDVRVLDCKSTEDGKAIRQLVEIGSFRGSAEEIARDIRGDPEVIDAYFTGTRSGRIVGTVVTRQAIVCRAILGSNSFCRNCLFTLRPSEDGKVRWSIALAPNTPLNDVLVELDSKSIDVNLVKLAQMPESRSLTLRQEEIIRLALEKGYFEYPRKVGVRALAKEIGISPSSLSELLRRAERKILSEYLRWPNYAHAGPHPAA